MYNNIQQSRQWLLLRGGGGEAVCNFHLNFYRMFVCTCTCVYYTGVVGTQTAVYTYHTDEPQPGQNSRLRLFHVLFEMTGSQVLLPSK